MAENKSAIFTTQHYEMIAELFRYDYNLTYAVMAKFAKLFEKDNPRFDRARFIRACGYAGTKENLES
jgi:hypothetical protein